MEHFYYYDTISQTRQSKQSIFVPRRQKGLKKRNTQAVFRFFYAAHPDGF
jgi:hypothetical protein